MAEELLIPKLAKAVEMEFGHILAVEANRKEQTMSRWIDADELGASVIKNTVFDKGDVIKLIEDAPSIEIIRCRECKYASDDGTYGCMCEHFNDTSDAYHRMWSDDFCSYGERRE